jgi:zinc/manganese transport system substrate-binding protein
MSSVSAGPVPRDASHPLRVLTTIAPIYSWTAAVAGTNAIVENLLPADIGPHDFQFRPRDLKRIQSADLILINGLGLEQWLDRALQQNKAAPGASVVAVSEGWPATNLIYDLPGVSDPAVTRPTPSIAANTARKPNPHVWLDPIFAIHAVTQILHALESADPENSAGYRANAGTYLDRLTRLDAEFRAATAQWKSRPVVTFHDAFPYFCRRYDLDLVGVIEEVPGNGPTPRHLAALLKLVRERHVGVLFTETQFNPRLARQLATDLAIPVAELDVLETGALTADAYEEGQRRNLATLRKYLR